MDARKIKILEAIINDYIDTGEPVASRTLAKKHQLGISAATIRNEMSDLEEMGFLEHIHTSSGRRPSSKGYRLYVDRLMKPEGLTYEEELRIKGHLINSALIEVNKIVKESVKLLSELTDLACFVRTPSVSKSYLKAIQLLLIDENTLVSTIVTDKGVINNSLIKIVRKVTKEEIDKIVEILNVRLKNLTIDEINLKVINSLKEDLNNNEEIFNAIIPALYESLKENEDSEFYLEGAAKILNYPEINDINKAREFLTFVTNKGNAEKLISTDDKNIITIGEENVIPEAKEISVLKKIYGSGHEDFGTIGIIGPTRMSYSKVLTILTKVVNEINDNLSKTFDDW